MSVSTTIDAPADTVFSVLADPTTHAAIDGTGWVRDSLDGKRVTEIGQVFRMAMYHEKHPDKDYEMANRVEVFEPPRAIAWQPGQGPTERGNLMSSGDTDPDDATIEYGGWIWRYDLSPVSQSQTEVTLTYDWSAVPRTTREDIGFPPFDASHLENSLKHLAVLATARS